MRIAAAMGVALFCALAASGTARGSDDAGYFAQLPDACSLLDARLAGEWLRARVDPSAANEHFPAFSSQCIYAGRGVVAREVRFHFKFMLNELFDVATLVPEQLNFNATLAAGGIVPADTLADPGRVSFAYARDPITMLLVVTGIRGPDDGTGRATVFVATYQLSDPETPHLERLAKLAEAASRHLDAWRAAAAPLP